MAPAKEGGILKITSTRAKHSWVILPARPFVSNGAGGELRWESALTENVYSASTVKVGKFSITKLLQFRLKGNRSLPAGEKLAS
jgi:hypothetical protein